jgi:hypothetical protein
LSEMQNIEFKWLWKFTSENGCFLFSSPQ